MKVAPLPNSSTDAAAAGESLSRLAIGSGGGSGQKQGKQKKKGKDDKNKDEEYLFLGLESAGKTLLIRRVKDHLAKRGTSSKRGKRGKFQPGGGGGGSAIPTGSFSTDVVPTIGVNVDTVKVGKKTVKLREVGGMMKPLWPTYLKACTALVFCIDMSGESAFVPSVVELAKLLSSQDLTGKPVFVVFNKHDAPCGICPSDIQNFATSLFDQDERRQRRVLKSFVASAYTGDGILDLVSSMLNINQ